MPEEKTEFKKMPLKNQLIAFMSTVCKQDQVSGTTTSTILKNLEPDTMYTVTVVPVYHEMEGKPLSENGKTSKSWSC